MKYLYIIVLAITITILPCCSKGGEVLSDDSEILPVSNSPFFYSQRLYSSGDYDSKAWRIPALLCTDQGVLLAINDKRKLNSADLPNDIDIVCRRSFDNGRTWSEPSYIYTAHGIEDGCGDPAIVQASNGDVICAYAGDNGTYESTIDTPINSYITISKDQGKTWGERKKITSQIWGPNAERPECRKYTGSFFTSGNGLRLERGKYAGRIMFVTPLCRPKIETDSYSDGEYVTDDYVIYSDDNGESWHMSECAYVGGDEGKMVELVDGSILMSIRVNGSTKRAYAYSYDGGITWSNKGFWEDILTTDCNGDIIRYSATDKGASQNILLQSLPNHTGRYKVSIFFSYDEGKTWHGPAMLFNGWSAYSSLTILKDGSIGAFIEQYGYEKMAIELWYMNFSFNWILSQALPES